MSESAWVQMAPSAATADREKVDIRVETRLLDRATILVGGMISTTQRY